ncbi:MAG: YggS family pyridoxal phosphate-dependent enzyme [Bacteroidota bacterium]
MSIRDNYKEYAEMLRKQGATLVAVSKTKSVAQLQEAYKAGCRIFGENKVQEMTAKQEALPNDIQWHLIGHLQTNKVKYIAPYVSLIHSIDSLKLLKEINKQAAKHDRIIEGLLQIHIAQEESKYGLSFEEAKELLHSVTIKSLNNAKIVGLMGMATFTEDTTQVKGEFERLRDFFEETNAYALPYVDCRILSMGMSGDYEIALQAGSNMVRIGSAIFGARA